MWMKKALIFAMTTCTYALHYTLAQTIEGLDGVEGMGSTQGGDYVVVGDFFGKIKIWEREGNQLHLRQNIQENLYTIWDMSMTDNHWLGVGYEDRPTVYVLNNSTKQFDPLQTLSNEYGVLAIHLSSNHEYLVIGKRSGYTVIYKLIDGQYQEVQRLRGE